MYEHKSSIVAEIVIEFPLCLDDAFERAESLQVRTPYICYYSAVGLHDVHERLDVARMACTHLHHGNFVLRLEAQQCLGHTDVIVEVALRVEHVVFLLQHCGEEFLRCRLTVCSRYADDFRAEAAAVVIGEQLQRVQTVLAEDEAAVAFRNEFGLVHYGVCASLSDGLHGEGVSVERCPLEGEEDGTFGAVAAVCRHHGVLLEDFVEFRYFHIFIEYCFVSISRRHAFRCASVCICRAFFV